MAHRSSIQPDSPVKRPSLIATSALFLLCTGAYSSPGEERITLAETLQRWEDSALATRTCSFDLEIITSSPSSNPAKPDWRFETNRFFREHEGRFEMIMTRWPPERSPNARRDPAKAGISRTLMNIPGESYVVFKSTERTVKGKVQLRLTVFSDTSMFAGTPYAQSSILDGFICTGTTRTATVLRDNPDTQLDEVMELIADAPCHVITATTKYGAMKLWLDPAKGFHCVRAEYSKREGDYAYDPGSRLPSRILVRTTKGDHARYVVSEEGVIDEVKLIKIKDSWIVTDAHVHVTRRFKDGGTDMHEAWSHRFNIDLAPDFEKLGAFKVDFPNGTPVWFEGAGGVRHEWRDGSVVPVVDDAAVSALDAAVDSIRKPLATQPAR